jgi:predicted O-methyltransferase YrrM
MGRRYLEALAEHAATANQPFDQGCDEPQLAHLAKLAALPGIRSIAEIGFNAGVSSFNFLDANHQATVYSFELGHFAYTMAAKWHLDRMFPRRHRLILGDSVHTVPQFHARHPGLVFDLIFIDGGHPYDAAMADLCNMRCLAHAGTVLVMDDITPWNPHGVGPAAAWADALRDGLITQRELIKEGRPVTAVEPPGSRLWAVGAYNVR